MPGRRARGARAGDLDEQIREATGAGRPVAVQTVDFADPHRPLTCLEVDFPILPLNEVAAIEGAAGKPIYQVSKWWARRRSSVFRALLLAAAMKAPKDPARAARAVWEVYYGNHQQQGALGHLRVLDPFMGGGTTVVEASRLGMQATGIDLNPVAWLIVRNELSRLDPAEVCALLAEIEREVRPHIAPYYACDCPRGHRGSWTRISTGEVMCPGFDPLALPWEQRGDYDYRGPEMLYVFWAKHGPCQVTGCTRRTPLLTSPVMAAKELSVRAWRTACRDPRCGRTFDIEERHLRMAPSVPLVVSGTERPFAVPHGQHPADGPGLLRVTCPHCGQENTGVDLRRRPDERKRVPLWLLVHPQWLAGEAGSGPDGEELGGRPTDPAGATAAWNRARARQAALVEVRGALPREVVCPETGVVISTGPEGGNLPQRSTFACAACKTPQDVLAAVRASGRAGPMAAYAIQGHCPECAAQRQPYGGRFFAPLQDSRALDAACAEWEQRREGDLAAYWPRSAIPYGYMTGIANGDLRQGHGYTHFWTLFNARQLLVHSQLLRAVVQAGGKRHSWPVREAVLGAFQQYLRNQSMLSFWNRQADKMEPMFSNPNYHPKATVIENSVFSDLGRGNWRSCTESLCTALAWAGDPWERVHRGYLVQEQPHLAGRLRGKSARTYPKDPVRPAEVLCASATDLRRVPDSSVDLVITDPPFGNLLHYSELSDFFYVWLRLVLKERYPELFSAPYVPKALEIVDNRARNPAGFYQRLLTAAFTECSRILRPGGLLAFTFHHSEDEPWVAVLQSLLDAGLCLAATYPVRSDETKGEGAFGSRKVQYDIICVCRKRPPAQVPVSWAGLHQEVLGEVRRLQGLLDLHQRRGLPRADLQIIQRGKALECYCRHHGQVHEAGGRLLSVKEAVLGVLRTLDEERGP